MAFKFGPEQLARLILEAARSTPSKEDELAAVRQAFKDVDEFIYTTEGKEGTPEAPKDPERPPPHPLLRVYAHKNTFEPDTVHYHLEVYDVDSPKPMRLVLSSGQLNHMRAAFMDVTASPKKDISLFFLPGKDVLRAEPPSSVASTQGPNGSVCPPAANQNCETKKV